MRDHRPIGVWPEPKLEHDRDAARAEGRLTALEVEVLAIAGAHWKYGGARDTAFLARCGISPVKGGLIVAELLDDPVAYVHDPQLIKRLASLAKKRKRQRTDPTRSTW